MAKEVEPYLRYFIQDNSKKSPEGLAEVAACLSPGGVHNSGSPQSYVRTAGMPIVSYSQPSFTIIVLAAKWASISPDPAKTELEEYEWEVDGLILDLDLRDPRRILVGEDRDFYDSLPDTYRLPGLCWRFSRTCSSRNLLEHETRHSGVVRRSQRRQKREAGADFCAGSESECAANQCGGVRGSSHPYRAVPSFEVPTCDWRASGGHKRMPSASPRSQQKLDILWLTARPPTLTRSATTSKRHSHGTACEKGRRH